MKANMMYYHIYLYYGNKYNYHCVITQTLQNGQTLGQFFELLYIEVMGLFPTDHITYTMANLLDATYMIFHYIIYLGQYAVYVI